MTSKEIRKSFLDFFESKRHTIVPSSPVVPFEDPTLLFTNAGMNQFKDVFLGKGTRDYSRAADTQKCIRAGGKHNDLEEVGMDGYHHTFFEMLGNWSFGDYYKKEAIRWAWELLTEVWKIPKEKLWSTVYRTDDEALEIWKSETDIDHTHILKFDEKDNFWEMGDTGPCGPCSEIHVDISETGCKPEHINAGREDVIEIWNLVFIQYNRDEKGVLHPLPKKHVDTGMGLERIVRVLNNKNSNYETDLFSPITKEISFITGKKYEGENISYINAIADHIRALTFAISDGAIPSNEGRGYVLRRILRRASRLARKLEYDKPLLYQLVDSVIEVFSDVFPEIKDKKEYIREVILGEENNFNLTLDKGLELFNDIYENIKNNNEKIFPGEDAFKLYDTYGFPIDLTQIIASEYGFTVDMKGFDLEMRKQKERARAARKDKFANVAEQTPELDEIIKKYNPIYNPYNIDSDGIDTEILFVNNIPDTSTEIIILKNNPFYSEAGGQISDSGYIKFNDESVLEVIDSKNKNFLYVNNPDRININKGDKVKAFIDNNKREDIKRNHSATHLLHAALREVLGSHIKQMGSLVSDEYLRFDFPHFSKLKPEEISQLEEIVNDKISNKIEVNVLADLPIEEANNIPNVRKFFGEKYGDKVRIVKMHDDFSVEFCGGTHVENTADIGLFKIVKEESISSGVRRIFARTGRGIIKLIEEKIKTAESFLNELSGIDIKNYITELNKIKTMLPSLDFKNQELMKQELENLDKIIESLKLLKEKVLEDRKQADKKLLKQNLQKNISSLKEKFLLSEKENGYVIIAEKFDIKNSDEFKDLGEEIRKILKNGVVLISSVINDKISLTCIVSDNIIKEKQLSAGKLISHYAKKLGGGGGGRPQIATAGGRDIKSLDNVMDEFINDLKLKLK